MSYSGPGHSGLPRAHLSTEDTEQVLQTLALGAGHRQAKQAEIPLTQSVQAIAL